MIKQENEKNAEKVSSAVTAALGRMLAESQRQGAGANETMRVLLTGTLRAAATVAVVLVSETENPLTLEEEEFAWVEALDHVDPAGGRSPIFRPDGTLAPGQGRVRAKKLELVKPELEVVRSGKLHDDQTGEPQ